MLFVLCAGLGTIWAQRTLSVKWKFSFSIPLLSNVSSQGPFFCSHLFSFCFISLCFIYFFNAIGCVAYTAISLSCWLGFQFPHISIQSSICGMSWTSKSDPCRLHLQEQQLIGIKGSAAKIFVPDTTGHLQLSSRVHALMGQSCFGSNRGNQPGVRQVVLILRLIGV